MADVGGVPGAENRAPRELEAFVDEFGDGELGGGGRVARVGWGRLSEQALDILREDVAFDVYRAAWGKCVDVSVLVGEGYQREIGEAIPPARDGEADAVDGEGAFFGDVAAQIFRNVDGEPPIVALAREARDAADAIDMPLHEMTA